MNRRSFLRTLAAVPFVGAALVAGYEQAVVRPFIRLTGTPYMTEWQQLPNMFAHVAWWYQYAEIDGRQQRVESLMCVSERQLASERTPEDRIRFVALAVENGYRSLFDFIELQTGRPCPAPPLMTDQRFIILALPLAAGPRRSA